MIVVFMLVVVFVVCAPIAKAYLAGEAGVGQKPDRAIDSGLAHGRILLMNKAIKVFSRDMALSAQEDIENKVPLRCALQTLLLDMFEEDFLLFGHLSSVKATRCFEKTLAFYTLLSAQKK